MGCRGRLWVGECKSMLDARNIGNPWSREQGGDCGRADLEAFEMVLMSEF